MWRKQSRFTGAGFGTQGTGNYDAPDIAMRNARPGEEHDLSHRFVANMEKSGKYLTRR